MHIRTSAKLGKLLLWAYLSIFVFFNCYLPCPTANLGLSRRETSLTHSPNVVSIQLFAWTLLEHYWCFCETPVSSNWWCASKRFCHTSNKSTNFASRFWLFFWIKSDPFSCVIWKHWSYLKESRNYHYLA